MEIELYFKYMKPSIKSWNQRMKYCEKRTKLILDDARNKTPKLLEFNTYLLYTP